MWGGMKRLLKYLKGTKHMKLTLGVESLLVFKWWIDTSYKTHYNCKGRIVAMVILSRGGCPQFVPETDV